MTKKPGQKAARSGEYHIVGPRGGKEHRATRGKGLSPLSPSSADVLVTKSGRTIIVSPATSNGTSVASWSKAFKK